MRILVTNDDGVQAEGILALKSALERAAEVFVVAPERPRSAAGHAITLHKPVRIGEVRLRDGSKAHAVSGTPADCVVLGAQLIMQGRVDAVFSGINHGPNLGWDVHYSGTVAAAKEAAMTGHAAVAISVASYAPDISYTAAAEFALCLAHNLHERPLPAGAVLNVNVPDLPADRIAGVATAFQGPRQYVDRFECRRDPSGREYYWLGGALADGRSLEGSDVRAIADSKISVTALHLDTTDYALQPELSAWLAHAGAPSRGNARSA